MGKQNSMARRECRSLVLGNNSGTMWEEAEAGEFRRELDRVELISYSVASGPSTIESS